MNLETKTSNVTKLKSKPSTESLRVKRETKKRINQELSQLNKKSFGRRVTPDELVSLAMSLLTPEHLDSLKQKSLTNKDRLELKYEEYCKANGKISKDEFLGILLGGK